MNSTLTKLKRHWLPAGLLLLGLPTPRCVAQSTWQIGIRIIPQSTTLRYDTGFPVQDFLKDTPYYSRVRAAFGIGVVYQPFPRWSIGADLLYSMQGGGYEERRTNLNYLKIPLWLGYSASADRKVQFNVQAGIDATYLVRATMRYRDGETVNIARYLNRTNWGPGLALGTKFKVGEQYTLNTQLLLYTDIRSLSKTDTAFGAHNYILPGLRLSLDRGLSPRR
jgi:hypothetical protein